MSDPKRIAIAGFGFGAEFIPPANLHHQRYTVCWKTMTAADWNAQSR